MTYLIETRDTRKLPRHAFLPLGEYRSRSDALFWAGQLAEELNRQVRVVRYRPNFEVIWTSEEN